MGATNSFPQLVSGHDPGIDAIKTCRENSGTAQPGRLTIITNNLLGGIGLLLYGIRLLGNSLTDLAGGRAEHRLASFNRKPLASFTAGIIITALLQSSSATTVMISCLAHGRIITPATAVAAIMGANIGTAVTPHLLIFSPGEAAGWLVAIGVFLTLLTNDLVHNGKSVRYPVARGILGLGLLLWGLTVVESATAPLASDPRIASTLATLTGRPGAGLLTGFLLTTVLDSSSVTIAILGRAVRHELLPLSDAIPVLLGNNIGTTTATLLASAALGPLGRRAALSHLMFNVIGTILFWPFRYPALTLVGLTAVDPARQLANTHLLFNAFSAVLQLPLLRFHLRIAEIIFPDSNR